MVLEKSVIGGGFLLFRKFVFCMKIGRKFRFEVVYF